MSFSFKLDKVNKLGDFDDTYGQRYWCASVDSELPLSFNTQNQDVMAGDTIEAQESTNKRSTKGTDYLQLKKVQVTASIQAKPSKPPEPSQTSLPDSFTETDRAQLQRVEDGINQLLGL